MPRYSYFSPFTEQLVSSQFTGIIFRFIANSLYNTSPRFVNFSKYNKGTKNQNTGILLNIKNIES